MSFLDDVTGENLAILPTSHIPQASFLTRKGGLRPSCAFLVFWSMKEKDTVSVLEYHFKKNWIDVEICSYGKQTFRIKQTTSPSDSGHPVSTYKISFYKKKLKRLMNDEIDSEVPGNIMKNHHRNCSASHRLPSCHPKEIAVYRSKTNAVSLFNFGQSHKTRLLLIRKF